MRGATKRFQGANWLNDFNPRSPCGERPIDYDDLQTLRNFNPRSPCGERRERPRMEGREMAFQSTLPMRGATLAEEVDKVVAGFQSTLPMRGATFLLVAHPNFLLISIHAPHAGSDIFNVAGKPLPFNFNPRSPCGERRRCHKSLLLG